MGLLICFCYVKFTNRNKNIYDTICIDSADIKADPKNRSFSSDHMSLDEWINKLESDENINSKLKYEKIIENKNENNQPTIADECWEKLHFDWYDGVDSIDKEVLSKYQNKSKCVLYPEIDNINTTSITDKETMKDALDIINKIDEKEKSNDTINDQEYWEEYNARHTIYEVTGSATVLLQAARAAESALEEVQVVESQYGTSYSYAASAVSDFEELLKHEEKELIVNNETQEETKADVRYRIGKIYYKLYSNYKNLSEDKRNHCLLAAYSILGQAIMDLKETDDFYYDARFYYAQVCYALSSKTVISEVLRQEAIDNFQFITDNEDNLKSARYCQIAKENLKNLKRLLE